MQKVGIVAKHHSPLAVKGIETLINWLSERNVEYMIDVESANICGMKSSVTKVELARDSDLIVVLGGDGTFLSVARLVEDRLAPILGVNLGSLGFLTEFAFEEMIPAIERVVAGDYTCEDRIMLDVAIFREGKKVADYTVINDLVINNGSLARMVNVRVNVDGSFVNEYTADGLIVSTPTGSTAYNLSAGGPIVYPSLNAIIISPICPHTLSNRPIVIPDNVTIELVLRPDFTGEAVATMDGQVGFQITYRDRITARRSARVTRIIRSPFNDYYQLLRGKLKWGEAIRHG